MKRKDIRWRSLNSFAVAWLLAAVALAGEGKSNAAWEKMKSLVGDWQGTMAEGDQRVPVSVSYRLVSKGTSLMETMTAPEETDMVTMYVPDGDKIVMTHYCSEGNQPRMRAAAPGGDVKKLDFRFVDATNLSSPDAMHMRNLVVTFQDANHFKQEWTHHAPGKDQTGVFEYTRKN